MSDTQIAMCLILLNPTFWLTAIAMCLILLNPTFWLTAITLVLVFLVWCVAVVAELFSSVIGRWAPWAQPA